ncbi:COMPASS (complex proteins associated with Set1p) component [Gnomoniopsis smithogilvyi]|uniref:COMPASS (Complex proteins associated with Set1p) component n=1 Tax=Gnomoniopsis smithogilvyi TaxID=1191159 RepID=A0A9W8Z0W0_9PEZI|nr:COMPASS (complex proteins associated with Set1p) component [Gnomoniopsis smithogilvyi]
MAEISSIINTPDTSATAQTEGVVTPMAAENNQIVEHDSALTLDGQNEQTKATPPPHSTSVISAAVNMRGSLKNYRTTSPSSLPPPKSDPKAKGMGKSSSERHGKTVIACENCHHKHSQFSSSPILAAATRSAEPNAPGTPPDSHAPATVSAPVNALGYGGGSTRQPLSLVHISSAPEALNNIFGSQSTVMSMALQVSRLDPNHEPSALVMASQGNPNGPAPAPATAPATAPVAAASRAPSAAPTPSAMPAEAAEHGAATRVYMNTKVTYHLLAGMKELAKHKPENPLRVLGEFLLARSAQYETGSVTTTSTAAGTSAAAGEDHIMGCLVLSAPLATESDTHLDRNELRLQDKDWRD